MRGRNFFTLLEELEARHVRHHHVTKDHVHRLLFEQGQRRFAAIRFETDETQSLAHGHAELADTLFVVDHQQPDAEFFFAESSDSPGFPHSFFDSRDQVLNTKRLLEIRRANLAQGGYGFFVGIVAGDDDYPVDKIGAIGGNPGMDLRAIDATGRAHVGNHAKKLAFFQQTQSFSA